MKLKLVGTVASFAVIYGLLVWYIGWNGWVFLASLFDIQHAGLYSAIMILIAIAFIIGRAGQSVRIPAVSLPARALKLIGSYWLVVLEYAMILLPLADIAALILKALDVSSDQYVTVVGSVVVVLIAALIIRGSWNAWTPIVHTYRVSVAKQAGGRHKLRIAVASDLHLGTIVGNRHLSRLHKELERMKPDLILFPGDVIDEDIEPYIRNNMSGIMSKLSAPLGVYAVLGNHEYYGGHIPTYIKEMNAIGIRVLQDEHVLIDNSFYLIGRKDLTAARPDFGGRLNVEELTASLNKQLPLIMMDHQPSDLDAIADNGIDISLSGHTHRGQFAPNHWITRRMFELDYGYLHKGRLHAIVSSGFGTWGPPVRIASRAEIVQVEVTFEPEAV
ncbi:metallophosphoesterase [Paenibacillus protaetiae]|uniref:Metallophosphoesterase n=1 Tax=Paenibacillus protaetiae TaxID=2509456 RepID=A0A4P6EYR7_9BACL|nr:metallophosphoesterase [Paenibacillus protaetiae]QAY68224.1 metallophosphoesterase [Paenibacillus protaetiae]